MTITNIKAIVEIEVLEVTEGFQAFVRYEDETILQTDPQKTERRAISEARVMFRKSLFTCNHKYGNWDEYSVDNSWGGTDYVQHRECELCSLTEYTASDRSMFEDWDSSYGI